MVGLAYSPEEDCLYTLERDTGAGLALRSIHRFNGAGASLGSIPIEPPIPISPERPDLFQLHYSSGKLVLVLPPLDRQGDAARGSGAGTQADRILVVDPASGGVSVAQAPPSVAAGSDEG